jgi:hypothetical protein
VVIVNEHHLQRVLDEYVDDFNAWRPHRGSGQRAPRGSARTAHANPTGPDHWSAGARGPASRVSACSLRDGVLAPYNGPVDRGAERPGLPFTLPPFRKAVAFRQRLGPAVTGPSHGFEGRVGWMDLPSGDRMPVHAGCPRPRV